MTVSNTYTCPACQHENPERYRYCRTCRSQTRCLTCNELLEANADMCFACGEPTRAAPGKDGRNTYTLREQSRTGADGSQEHSLSVDVSVETEGLQHLGTLMGLASGGAGRRAAAGPTLTIGRQAPLSSLTAPALPVQAEMPVVPDASQSEVQPVRAGDRYAQWVLDRFEAVGDEDVATTITNLRGRSLRENQIRFTVLYTLAFQALLHRKPEQAQVAAALQKKGIVDKNHFSVYYRQVHQTHFVDVGDWYRLTDEGQRYIAEVIQSFDGPAEDEPFRAPSKARRAVGVKRPRITEEELATVGQLVDASATLPVFETKSVSAPRELNALALWLSSRVLGGPPALSSRMVFEYLNKFLAGRMPYKAAQVSEGFIKRDNGFFRQNAQGHYLLTDRGEKFAEEWLATQGHHELLRRAPTHAGTEDNA